MTTIEIKTWLVQREGIASRFMTGEVTNASARAIRFKGFAVVREADHCLRCGRAIDNPISRLAGYGPICSDRLGIPRDFTPDQVEAIRKAVERFTEVEFWLPRSAILSADGSLDPPANGARAPECSITAADSLLVVVAPFKFKDAIKELPGRRWDPQRKAWTLPQSPVAARAALDLLAGAGVVADEETTALADADVHREALTQHKTAEALPEVPSATPAWHHQRQAFWFAKELDSVMLAMDMGTGKSKVAVDLACARSAQRVLVICPNSVVGVWPREFKRHASCPVDVVGPRRNTITKRAEVIRSALAAQDRPRSGPEAVVAVVNYEAAWREPMASLLLSVEWDLVVLDESHRIKKPGGKASLFCARLRSRAATRLCLTGTPMPHSPLDVYAQYRFLDPGIFGTSFVSFRNRYAVMGGYGGKEVLGFQRQDELAERMYRIGFRVMADDVLDLPPVLHVRRTTLLEPKARKVYEALARDLYAEVAEGTVTVNNALTRLLRLQQVTSGHTMRDDEAGEESERRIEVGIEKRSLFADTIEDLPTDEPIVVFCRFTHDLDSVRHVAESQGRRYGELSGRRRDGLTDDALMAPDVDVLGVQIQAGGVGIDLTRARYCVFYSVGFSLGDYDQALRRVHRPGQVHPTMYFHLVCEDTIDEGVYDALEKRKDLVEYVLGLG